MVGSGDRSEKIRTYNFPQSRVTDHRIGYTSHRLADVLDGRLDELIDPLVAHFQAEKLKEELAKAGYERHPVLVDPQEGESPMKIQLFPRWAVALALGAAISLAAPAALAAKKKT